MKVMHAAETIKGGVATVVQLLSQGMLDDSHTVIRCLVPASQEEELRPLPQVSLRTFADRGRGIFTCIMFMLSFGRNVLSFRPDIVHLHSTFAGLLGRIVLLLLRPIVRPAVIYCPHAFSFMMSNAGSMKVVYAHIERLLYRFTDAIVCVSRYERDLAIGHGLPARKLRLIHNGTPLPPPMRLDRASGGTGPLQILFVGRFDFAKGFDVLSNAMRELEDFPVQLTVIGADTHGDQTSAPLRNVTFLGWLPRAAISKHYYESDVLIVPSRWEGFAMAPLEAMSHGVPVIASRIPSLSEIVSHGRNGLLFDPEDAKSLAEAIRSTSKQDLARMGAVARADIEESFSADCMVRATRSLYSEVLAP